MGQSASIRQAATTLNVTHTAVARQIKELELWFGARLVETNSRGTVLNAEGYRLHACVSDAFDQIAQGAAEIRPSGNSSELRVWGTPGFATFWILPRLAEIQKILPRVNISLLPTEQTPSFDKGEADVEVRYGQRISESLVNIELARPRVRVLASSRWIREHPHIKTPQDLLDVELVHERRRDDWGDWFTAVGIPHKVLQGPKLGVLPAVLEALHRDRGPGLIPEPFMDTHVLRNNLQPVMADAPRLRPYVLVFHKDRAKDEVVLRFADWLKQSLARY